MIRTCIRLALVAGLASQAHGAAVKVGAVVDAEEGRSFDLDAWFEPTPNWTIAAGAGQAKSSLEGERFSGTSLRASTDVSLGAFFAGAAAERWKDSGELRSTVLQGEFGWMSDAGVAISALVVDRSLRVDYTFTALGETRTGRVDFEGTGLGADISWYGESWFMGARLVDYQYGNSMERVRAVLNSPNTDRFPRLQLLADSVVTRLAGAPDREISAMVGRQFSRTSVFGSVLTQRDALTGSDLHGVSMALGYRATSRVEIGTTLGFTDGETGTVAWGGLSLTLRSDADD